MEDVDPIAAGRILLSRTHRVGIRCWTVRSDGTLGSPCRGGERWGEGVVRCKCERGGHLWHRSSRCHCGLYGYRRESVRSSDAQSYFDMDSATAFAGAAEVVGGVAYWNPRWTSKSWGGPGVFNAEYAVVAALSVPARASGPLRSKIRRAAERYGVEIVAPTALEAAVDEWVDRARRSYLA